MGQQARGKAYVSHGSLKPLMASVVEKLRSGVLITDPQLPDNPIVYANAGFSTVTGYAAEEVLGRNCRFLQGPDTDPQCVEEMREAISARRVFSGLILNYRKDGTPFCNGLVINPLFDEKGELIHFVGLINDVSVPREQLRALTARVTAAREQERTEIAREIHDELGQQLTGLKLDVAWLKRRITAIAAAGVLEPREADSLGDKMQAMSEHMNDTIHSVRRIAIRLRPPLLDDLGLAAAIEWHLQEFEKRTEIICRFLTTHEEFELDQERATALFRIFQEALTNVARHAQATEVEVRLEITDSVIMLTVKDNGRGLDGHKILTPDSLGLLGMKERALSVNGEVTLEGRAGLGTTVTIEIPRDGKRSRGTP